MDQEEVVQQTPLRDTLTAAFDAVEAATPPEAGTSDRARDEQGRFAKAEAQVAAQAAPVAAPAKVEAPQGAQLAVQVPAQRPITTWKKEYLGIYDKLAAGQPLTPEESKKLADYSVQRENEYKTGVSTYRTEAQQARELQEAITPFLPELQSRNVKPADWIKQLGEAHYVLVKGSPEQKIRAFQTIAQNYGVPMAAIQQQGAQQPVVTQLMQMVDQQNQIIADLNRKVSGVDDWRQQMDMQSLQAEVQKAAGDAVNYPHFEMLREDMARLLETGAARDIPTAYKMAERMNDELYEAGVSQRLAAQQQSKAQVVKQAKAQTVSPKSATPSGSVAASGPRDRRSILAEQFDAQGGGRV